jgi:predicted deacylase
MEVRRIEVTAPSAGILRQSAPRVGDLVARGDLLARITNLNGTWLADVVAPSAGVLALRRHAAPVAAGELIAAVFVDAASA